MTRPLQICVLTDGKPGHQNQSLGLAEAIGRRAPAAVSLLEVPAGKLRSLGLIETPEPRPDLFIGAGHATHAPLLQLARRTGAPCVVMMKPSLPAGFFDLCLVPEHDLGGAGPAPNVIATKGALNRVPPPDPDRARSGGLLLIGGPSGSHGWDAETTTRQVAAIVDSRSALAWRATDSRRTPEGFLEALQSASPAFAPFPHQQTGRDWLPQQLAHCEEVWVSEDSVSMIYEALSSGAAVGLLPVPRKSRTSRVARGIDRLAEQGWLTPFDDWRPGTPLPRPPATLREADRTAAIVLERFFPDRR
ncbi:mitochondrial fission ELM1 family protein [Haloferula sargassicola]|uniref:Nucleoside-diphosphate sugar epimerase n=1 Tax=Haloferula sargassicola TaxID=490096 RepID=A0ABP9UTQ1_9BACT